MAKLARYREKRDFSRTDEPAGSARVAPAPHPRFVIQKHAARRLHYDLRLEVGGVFKSWAVTRGPSLDPKERRLAVEVEDHPLEYGDFEGTIPQGEYGGGTVMVWDRGFWLPEEGADAAEALQNGEMKFVLAGEKLRGGFVLVRLKHDREGRRRSAGTPRTNWLLIKHRDGTERPGATSLPDDDRSVASGRTMTEITAGQPPGPKAFMTGGGSAGPDAVWSSAAGSLATSGPKRGKAPAQSQHADRTAHAGRAAATPRPLRGRRTAIPEFVPPQLCQSVARPPEGTGWVHELKLDGYRMQLRVDAGVATMRSRNGLDWTDRFRSIADAARARIGEGVLLDGEVVALDANGAPDFAALQAALSAGRSDHLVYFAFEALFAESRDQRGLSLSARKAALESLCAASGLVGGDAPIRYLAHFEAAGEAVLRSACRLQLEGIVSKRIDAPSVTGCGPAWTKAKCRGGQEVVVAGWSGDRRTLRSLVVGVHRGGRLVHVGRVGTGFTQETARRLLARLLPLATKESPFDGTDAPKPARDVTWVEPRLVAEIEFAGWTGAGAVRQAAFKGLREDKSAIEIVDERPDEPTAHAPATNRWSPVARRAASLPAAPAAIAPQAASHGRTSVRSPRSPASAAQSNVVAGIVVSNPAKALWPEPATDPAVVKLDLARYYEAVAPHLMAHIAGRPCSLVRAPDGIGGEQFFQRHAMPGMSSLISLVKVKGDRKPYVQLDRPEALVAVAQIAAVELHPWNCAPGEPELPGRLVFDLDPAPDVDFADVVTAAKELKGRLEALGLTTFCKTTGGKGLHVVIPLDVSRPGYRVTWEQAKAFAQAVCATMAADSPDRYLIKMTKALRGGRIFLDYLRNDRTATAVAPLSPRARPGAAVSMPLAWSQMTSRLDPARYTIRTVPRLVAHGFAWEGYDAAARPLADAIRRLVTPRS